MANKHAAIETAKLRKAFKESAEGQAYIGLATTLYRYAFSGGLSRAISALQGRWAPLSEKYRKWKAAKGFDERAWVKSGATLRAIENNPPERPGTKGGLRFGINFSRDLVFARPTKFKSGKGGVWKELSNSKFQEKVFNTLRYGSRKAKIASWAAKRGKDAAEHTGRDRGGMLPGRPLFAWLPEIVEQAKRDVSKYVEKLLNGGSQP